jgi:hypothetical protein
VPSFALDPIPTVCFAIYPSSKVLLLESSVTLVESNVEEIVEAVIVPTAPVAEMPVKDTVVGDPGAVPVATTCPTEPTKKGTRIYLKVVVLKVGNVTFTVNTLFVLGLGSNRASASAKCVTGSN